MSSDNSFFKNDKKNPYFSEFGSSPSKFLSIWSLHSLYLSLNSLLSFYYFLIFSIISLNFSGEYRGSMIKIIYLICTYLINLYHTFFINLSHENPDK